MEHQIWFTALLNKLLAGVVTPMLVAISGIQGLAWVKPEDPAHPIPNYVAMQVMVILVILMGALLLRRRLSVEKPGKFQHAMEVVVEFTRNMNEEIIGHHSERYIGMIATLGIFVVVCNLWGLIPTLSTPTAQIQVTLGCAVAAFLYYNFHGSRQHGVPGYLKHLSGPRVFEFILFQLMFASLMFAIEVFSNVGRLLSLSVRLYANMMVGNVLENVFGVMIPSVFHSLLGSSFLGQALPALMSATVPVVFMALHIFVSLLQAYIFMLLPAIYISMAVSEEH
jgi:F-type H+-transporting ATPase subunit a